MRLPAIPRPAAWILATALVAVTLPALAAPAAADPPPYGATLVGPSQADMYPSGLEYDPVNDRLVIADTGLDRILLYTPTGTKLGEFGTAGSADGQFLSPRDTAIDGAGNIYVADAENNRIQKFTSAGVWQWTRGGTGSCSTCLNTPIGVTWDSANNQLLVASTGQNLIKSFDANGNWIWTSPSSATLGIGAPRDVQRDPAGRLWITDYKNHYMKAYDVDSAGVFASTAPTWSLGGNGQGLGQLNFPYNAVWSADGNTMYVSDTGNGRVARWDLSGTSPVPLSQFGHKCSVHPAPCPDPPASQGEFNHLRRVARDAAGNIFAADFWGNGIEVFRPDGSVLRQIAGATASVPGVAEAYGVAVGPDGTTYVMDRLNQRIERFSSAGHFLNHAGSRGTAGDSFSWPEAVAVAPDGYVWAADTRGDRISKWPANLSTTPSIPTWGSTGTGVGQFNYIEDLDVAPDGRVFIADTRNHRIQIFDPVAQTFTAFGGQGSGNGQFSQPQGVAVDSNAVYVADTGNNRIQKLSLAGVWQASYSTGLSGPEGIDVASDGTVWVADTGNNRVIHMTATLNPFAGDTFGSAGTGTGQFDRPHTLAAGSDTLFVADTYNDRVQTFTLQSGGGMGPYAPQYEAQISAPGGVAPLYPAGGVADGAGNRYLADSGGSRIVKIDSGGTQTTVLESGLNDPRKIVFDTAGSDLWVADTSDSQVLRITTTGSVVSTFGGTSVFKTPYGLDNDTTGVYVADTYNNRVRKIDKTTGTVLWTQTTCASKAFSRPRDLTVGSDGKVYVADTDNARIVPLDPTSGACSGNPFGSKGTGNNQFNSPRAITSDGSGGLWIAEAWNYRAKHVTNTGTFIAKTTSTQGSGTNQFRAAQCVFLQGNILNVCDTYGYRINRYTVDGAGVPAYLDVLGGTAPTPGGFNGAYGAGYGPNGELYVADWFNHRIQRFNPDGTFDTEWGGYGFTNGSLIFPTAVAVANGNVVVTDSENNRIQLFSTSGSLVGVVKPATGTPFSRPHQTAVAADGTYWVADTLNNRVVHIDSSSNVLGTFTTGLNRPRGIAIDSSGNLYVSNTDADKVEKRNSSGTVLATLTTSVNDPYGLAIGTYAGVDVLFVSDFQNDRIVAMNLDGTSLGTFGSSGSGTGQLDGPRGVAVDPTDGQIAVADWANSRISVWAGTGGGGPDVEPPDAVVTAPTNGQSIPAGTVVMTGNATDNVGVTNVDIAIKNSATGQWWKGSGWGSGATYLPATLGAPGTNSTSWTFSWPAPGPGQYGISVRARDAAGNIDPTKPWVNFTVVSGDTTPPDATVTVPTANQVFPLGTVTFTGNATDNVGVAYVRVAVKDRTTGQWWNGNSWQTAFVYFANATLETPGGTSTSWSFPWPAPSAGNYQLLVRADDANANIDPTKPFVNFSVS